MLLRYKKLNENAVEPTYGSQGAAGLDLYSTDDYWIKPGGTVKIGTGIAVEIPPGYFGAVYARSGLATKYGLRPANCVGIIDEDYRGEVVVAMYNDGDIFGQQIHKGDRIAQLVIQPCMSVILQETDELSSTERGDGGFGSTDKPKVCVTKYSMDEHGNLSNDCIYDYEQITLYDVIKENTDAKGGDR